MSATFIKAAEVWVPSADGSLLDFSVGAYGSAKSFAAISRHMCFGRGEGLPGRAWDEGRPILLAELSGSSFRRSTAARAAGLGCAVALPLFVHETLTAVLVIFCGHQSGAGPAQTGALELWHHDARAAAGMTLVAGAYGPASSAFEAVSQQTTLAKGAGLPGLAWQRGQVLFMEDLAAESSRFMRAAQAAEAGLLRGLAIPVSARRDDSHVVAFLASATLPLAQRIERWVPDASRTLLRRTYAFSELHGGSSLAEASLPVVAPPGTSAGSIAMAWASGVPAITEDPRAEPGAPAAAAASLGASALIAIPVVWEGAVVEVVALYL